jgi:uncharacterized protein (DUF58 family)
VPVSEYGELLDALRGVTWPARRAALAGTSGTHRSRLRGLSAEFTEYRPYRQGDDPRRLDWKLLARTDRAYQRVTSDRATLATLVVLDASASMAFPEGATSKWEQARRLAVGLAAVAHAAGDPVGLLIPTSSGLVRVEPRTRRGIVAQIVRSLRALKPQGDAALGPALAALRLTPRVAVLSDFLGDEPAMLREAANLMAGGTEVHAVHLVAREELAPTEAAVLATDPERPELARPLTAETCALYLRAFAEWRQGVSRAWRAAGAAYTEVVADEPAARAVRRVTAPPPREAWRA